MVPYLGSFPSSINQVLDWQLLYAGLVVASDDRQIYNPQNFPSIWCWKRSLDSERFPSKSPLFILQLLAAASLSLLLLSHSFSPLLDAGKHQVSTFWPSLSIYTHSIGDLIVSPLMTYIWNTNLSCELQTDLSYTYVASLLWCLIGKNDIYPKLNSWLLHTPHTCSSHSYLHLG